MAEPTASLDAPSDRSNVSKALAIVLSQLVTTSSLEIAKAAEQSVTTEPTRSTNLAPPGQTAVKVTSASLLVGDLALQGRISTTSFPVRTSIAYSTSESLPRSTSTTTAAPPSLTTTDSVSPIQTLASTSVLQNPPSISSTEPYPAETERASSSSSTTSTRHPLSNKVVSQVSTSSQKASMSSLLDNGYTTTPTDSRSSFSTSRSSSTSSTSTDIPSTLVMHGSGNSSSSSNPGVTPATNDKSGSLSVYAIIGIVAGALILIAGLYFAWDKWRKDNKDDDEEDVRISRFFQKKSNDDDYEQPLFNHADRGGGEALGKKPRTWGETASSFFIPSRSDRIQSMHSSSKVNSSHSSPAAVHSPVEVGVKSGHSHNSAPVNDSYQSELPAAEAWNSRPGSRESQYTHYDNSRSQLPGRRMTAATFAVTDIDSIYGAPARSRYASTMNSEDISQTLAATSPSTYSVYSGYDTFLTSPPPPVPTIPAPHVTPAQLARQSLFHRLSEPRPDVVNEPVQDISRPSHSPPRAAMAETPTEVKNMAGDRTMGFWPPAPMPKGGMGMA